MVPNDSSDSADHAAQIRDEVLDLPRPCRLHYGDELPRAHIAYRLAGPQGAPVIAVLGGISAHRVVHGEQGSMEAFAEKLTGKVIMPKLNDEIIVA